MRLKPGLFIIAAFLFPSLLLASREEAMNETLEQLESAGKIKQMDTSVNAGQGTYEAKKYLQAKESLEKDGSLFKKEVSAPASSQAKVSGRAISPKTKPVKTKGPVSRDIQNYYSYAFKEYQKSKGDLEKKSLFQDKKEDVPEETGPAKGVFYISGGYDNNHLHYKELEEDRTLDENYANLQGFYAEAGYKSGRYLPWIKSRPFVEAYFKRYDGSTFYKGAWSDGLGGGGPFNTDQRAVVYRYGIKAGAYWDFLRKGEISPYLDLGSRIWDRGENETIDGIRCYKERYYWTYLGLGTRINYRIFDKLTCGAELEGMFAVDAKMRDLDSKTTFKLRGVTGLEFKFPLKYYLLKNVSLNLTPYVTFWNIAYSRTVIIDGSPMYEPDSHTHMEGVLAGVTYLL